MRGLTRLVERELAGGQFYPTFGFVFSLIIPGHSELSCWMQFIGDSRWTEAFRYLMMSDALLWNSLF